MIRIFLVIIIVLSLAACTVVPRPDIAIPAVAPPEILPSTPPRVALVLGSGGTRGFAEIGALKLLEDNHIPIDLIVGSSIGSLIGVLYADDPDADLLISTANTATKDDLTHFALFGVRGGFDNGYTLQNFVLKNIQASTFSQLKIKCVAVATDLLTGKTIPITSGPIAPAINASSAIPPIFRPVFLYGHLLIDGGISDGLAVDVAKTYHPQVIIAVNVVRDPPLQLTSTNAFSLARRAYLLETKNFAQLQLRNADIVITPKVGMAGTFDFSSQRQMESAGWQAAKAALPKIQELLKEKKIAYLQDKARSPISRR